jgi:alkylhydroperoxidase family enzyme
MNGHMEKSGPILNWLTSNHEEAVMYDIENLGRMKNLAVHASQTMQAFVAFDKAALAEGAIPRKYKELMAIAVALTTQCPYCIELHTDKRERQVPRIPRSPNPCLSRQRCAQAGPSPMAPMP